MLGEMRKFFWMLAGLAASLAAGCSNDDGNDGPTVCPDPEPLSQLTADVSLTVQSADGIRPATITVNTGCKED